MVAACCTTGGLSAISSSPQFLVEALAIGSTLRLIEGISPGMAVDQSLRQLLRAHALPVYYGGSCGSRGWTGGASTSRSHRGLTCKIPPVSPVRIDGRAGSEGMQAIFFLALTGDPDALLPANFTRRAQGAEIVLRPPSCCVTRSCHCARPLPAFLAKPGFRDTPPFRSDQGR